MQVSQQCCGSVSVSHRPTVLQQCSNVASTVRVAIFEEASYIGKKSKALVVVMLLLKHLSC
jgi:hypothetical protein